MPKFLSFARKITTFFCNMQIFTLKSSPSRFANT